MEVLFFPVKYKKKINFGGADFSKLPKKISICYVVQFSEQIKELIKELRKKRKIIISKKEVLGCSDIAKGKEEAFLYVGTGKFHPINIALKTEKKVFVLNPIPGSLSLLSSKEVRKYEKIRERNKKRFLEAKKVGILVSTKPGQNNLELAKKFAKKIEKKGKEAIIFIADFISLGELENFPQIKCWVNTACPRIIDDVVDSNLEISLVNIEDVF